VLYLVVMMLSYATKLLVSIMRGVAVFVLSVCQFLDVLVSCSVVS
jgi:hypothetical protein